MAHHNTTHGSPYWSRPHPTTCFCRLPLTFYRNVNILLRAKQAIHCLWIWLYHLSWPKHCKFFFRGSVGVPFESPKLVFCVIVVCLNRRDQTWPMSSTFPRFFRVFVSFAWIRGLYQKGCPLSRWMIIVCLGHCAKAEANKIVNLLKLIDN